MGPGFLGTAFLGAAAGQMMDMGQSQENVVEAIVAAPSKGPGWGSTGP